MIIQTITLYGIFGRYWNTHYFTKITDNNGKLINFIHNEKEGLTLEEMNEIYKSLLKSGKNVSRKITKENISIDDYIERLYDSIDEYVEYIDNGRQYDEACRANEKIKEKIKVYEELKEMGVE